MHARRFWNALLILSIALAGCALAIHVTGCASEVTASNNPDGSADGPAVQDSTTDTATTQDTGSGADVTCSSDTMTDPENCGACGIKCPSGNTCSCGMCTPPCTGTMVPCCGKCVDVETDPDNCGTCQMSCSGSMTGNVPGNPVCVKGQCAVTCPTDAGLESGAPVTTCGADSGTPGCFDLTSSAVSCGACGNMCPAGDNCVDSKCCPVGDGVCNGTCTPFSTAQNCGGCGVTCPAPATCMSGMCVGYVESIGSMPFIDACTLTGAANYPAAANQDGNWQESGAITLPFSFSFFGAAVTTGFAGSNGTMGLTGPSLFHLPPDCSMAPSGGFPSIEAFDDQNMNATKVCAATLGTAPNQQFVMTWENVTEFSDPSFLMNISVVLTQTTNAIDLLYQAPNAAGDGGLGGGSDAATEGGTGDGGTTGTPITDTYMQGSNATIQLQQSLTVKTALSCHQAFVLATPYDVHLVP